MRGSIVELVIEVLLRPCLAEVHSVDLVVDRGLTRSVIVDVLIYHLEIVRISIVYQISKIQRVFVAGQGCNIGSIAHVSLAVQ